MRRVRSQLDNLAHGGADSYSDPYATHIPVGLNRQTDQVQRRLDAMGYGQQPWMQQPVPEMPYAPSPYTPFATPALPQAFYPPHAYASPQSAPPTSPAGPELANIKSSIERLTSKLQQLAEARTDAKPATPAPEETWLKAQFAVIADELAGLRQVTDQLLTASAQETDLEGFRKVISANYEDLANQIDQVAGNRVDPEVFAQAVEASHAELLGQVETLRAMLENAPAQQNQTDHTDGMTDRLDELTRAVMALSAPAQPHDGIERIEARVSDLARTIDAYVSSAASEETGNSRPIAPYLSELQESLAAIDERLGSIAPASQSAIDGLASQLNRLSEKLDNFSAVSGTPESSEGNSAGLINRLDTLVERVEALGGAADPTALVALESRIEKLSADIGSMHSLSAGISQGSAGANGSSQEILEKLNGLATRIDEISSVPSDGSGDGILASLEQQLSAIAGRLESVGGGDGDTGRIHERLTGIEQQIGASRDIAIELASQVAEDAVKRAVESMPTNGGVASIDPESTQVLVNELRQLQSLSQDSSNSSLKTFDAVRDSLDSIVNRLARIEGGMGTLAEQATVAPMYSAELSSETNADQAIGEPGKPEHLRSREEFEEWRTSDARNAAGSAYAHLEDGSANDPHSSRNIARDLPDVPSPELSLSDMPESAPDATDTDSPLEPGTGTPDLAALVRHANKRKSPDKAGGDLPTGTDFITAARLAAQAAAAEAESAHQEVKEEGQKGKLGGLGGLLRKRKKVLLVAAAAVLVIALSFPLAGKFLGGGKSNVASVPVQTEQLAEQSGSVEVDNSIHAVEDQSTGPDASLPTAPEEFSQEPASGEVEITNEVSAEPLESQTAPASPEPRATSLSVEDNIGSGALKQAVSANNPAALFEVGRRYTDGVNVERNLATAAEWYERSAALGFAPAQYRIGNFYEKGHGIPADAAKAATWYELAANNGNVISMHNLAVLHAEGKVDGSPNMKTAFEWFKKAAEYGVRDSQVNVGIFYAKGVDDVKQDLGEAYKWFSVAAKAGDSDAARKRDTVANAMKPEDLETARAEAELWKPVQPEESANTVIIPDSWKAAGSATTASTSQKEVIAMTQAMLAKLGFDPGPADGLMGQKTKSAIMAFQQRSGLAVNGKISAELIDALKAVSI